MNKNGVFFNVQKLHTYVVWIIEKYFISDDYSDPLYIPETKTSEMFAY